MKALMIIISSMFFVSLASAEVSNNGYQCVNTGGGVCAKRLSTGQCTHHWDNEGGGNPMFHCKKFIGIKVSNFNKANYFCRDHGGYVCAASKKTNQCTHSWDNDDHNDPMFACKKFLGLVKTSFDKSKFRCKKTGGNVCAQSIVTGQCTHVWDNEGGGNPMWQCQNWLKK